MKFNPVVSDPEMFVDILWFTPSKLQTISGGESSVLEILEVWKDLFIVITPRSTLTR